MFNSDGEPMFDELEFFNTYVEKIPIGMKRKIVFYELPCCEHLKIAHLLDPMHMLENVSSFLWRHISSKKVTHWVLGKILFLQKLKINIGREKKVVEKLVSLGHIKKVMSHGFQRKTIFLW